MGTAVITVTTDKINQLRDHYSRYIIDKLPQGSVFAAKTPVCMVTAYKSGKVLFQGAGAESEAAQWAALSSSPAAASPGKKTSQKPAPGSHLPAGFGLLSVIGSDEVGTGDYFGPITVVAAYARKQDFPLLKELGVRDSKDLNDEKIIAIAKDIKDVIPYSLLTLHNEKYNKLQQSGMSQGKLKALLHNQAIGHVLKKIAPETPDAILIDQFAERGVYYNHLRGQQAIIRDNVYFSTKAEGLHLSVAAASILARYAFIRHFENLSEAAGFLIPKGAGPKVDEAAAKLILAKGQEVLPKFVKLHFANTQKAMNLVSRRRSNR
ncbi:ribonuclease HIII [Bacillus sp. FJAT-27225]|uniref:ribonuclease HIII n=1 Tax=Bacillus sp. FJAT-27225 TaxID=1743144 RepID=UPI00080C23B5|nr:ribonuclease HIII [Bacillus sp. FJAT-27225]OCA91334.1 ribonuclease HIII [Bacillus sp. FJAT-27225]